MNVSRSVRAVVVAICFALTGAACVQSESTREPTEADIAAAAEHKAAVDAAMEKANELYFGQDYAEAAGAYLEVIKLDPGVGGAHSYYKLSQILALEAELDTALDENARDEALNQASDAVSDKLLAQYKQWIQENPDEAGYRWALGQLYMYKDYDKVEQHTKEALEIDPKLAAAYQTLALLADVSGDVEQQVEYLRLASESEPDNPAAMFYYSQALRHTDEALYRETALKVADEFPEHERGAQSLYWLAERSTDTQEKIAGFELLRSNYAPGEFRWSASGMSSLFDIYTETDPAKAMEIAEEMLATVADEPEDSWGRKTWSGLVEFQASINKALDLIERSQFADAAELLENTTIPRHANTNGYHRAKARALDGAGRTADAYAFLLEVAADKPTDIVREALLDRGAKLGKSVDDVDAEIAAILEGKTEALEDYSWERYDNGETISLSDFNGKVVLLNFWYPFCGPCRGENPHIQEVLEKYGPEGFVVLALNVHPEEDKFVMPYAIGMGFDFIQLRSSTEFAEEEFQARGMPTNILIDTQGRKVLRLPPISGRAIRTLELQIEFLLPRARVSR